MHTLRFFFDHNSGGCLWPGDEQAIQRFGPGPVDAGVYDADGQLLQAPSLELPEPLKAKIQQLDQQYSTSLNWEDPAGPSLWGDGEWEAFRTKARALYEEIVQALGPDFEVVFEQE